MTAVKRWLLLTYNVPPEPKRTLSVAREAAAPDCRRVCRFGGHSRAKKFSAERRSQSARHAARVRWSRER